MNKRSIWILVLIIIIGGGVWWGKAHKTTTAADANQITANSDITANTDLTANTAAGNDVVANAPIEYNGVDGQNALDLLKASHKVDAQTSSYGDFVTGIDGQAAPSGYFWEFLVNGQQATVGAGSYVTKATDVIDWRLTKISVQ